MNINYKKITPYIIVLLIGVLLGGSLVTYANKVYAGVVAGKKMSAIQITTAAGICTVLDLLVAQSALASARLQRIQAQLDWNVYRATLAQSMGALDYTLLQAAAEGRP